MNMHKYYSRKCQVIRDQNFVISSEHVSEQLSLSSYSTSDLFIETWRNMNCKLPTIGNKNMADARTREVGVTIVPLNLHIGS